MHASKGQICAGQLTQRSLGQMDHSHRFITLQVQSMMQQVYNYRSVSHALASIVQQQGKKGLMKGYWATNSVWFPWNMIYVSSYEKSRASLAQRLQVAVL